MRDSVIYETDLEFLNPEAVSYRIDSAFNRAVFDVWVRDPELYRSIAESLNVPVVNAARYEIEWQSYRAKLIHDFEIKPIFGQEETKAAISSLYIPLRAFENDISTDNSQREGEVRVSNIYMLDDHFSEWLDNPSNDYLRLIGGGPGSGKSTSLKSLARTIADRHDWRPLFISLQHINISSDLRTELNKYFTERTHGEFTIPPLSRESVENGAPLVLIFDGLDEIALPGESASDVVNIFRVPLEEEPLRLQSDTGFSLRLGE